MQDNQDTPVGKERKENRLLEELESKELRLVTLFMSQSARTTANPVESTFHRLW